MHAAPPSLLQKGRFRRPDVPASFSREGFASIDWTCGSRKYWIFRLSAVLKQPHCSRPPPCFLLNHSGVLANLAHLGSLSLSPFSSSDQSIHQFPNWFQPLSHLPTCTSTPRLGMSLEHSPRCSGTWHTVFHHGGAVVAVSTTVAVLRHSHTYIFLACLFHGLEVSHALFHLFCPTCYIEMLALLATALTNTNALENGRSSSSRSRTRRTRPWEEVGRTRR